MKIGTFQNTNVQAQKQTLRGIIAIFYAFAE